MILKYQNQIIDVRGNINDLDELKVTIEIEYSLKYDTQEKCMLIENSNQYNSFIGRFRFEDLEMAKKLIEDIKENYKKGTEFYNVETKIKEIKESSKT